MSNCSHFGVPCVPPVFSDSNNGGSDFPEINVLSRYVPRPQCILVESGRLTVEGVVGPNFGIFCGCFLLMVLRVLVVPVGVSFCGMANLN